MFNKLHEWLLALPEHYPELIDYTMIDTFLGAARARFWALVNLRWEIVDYFINEPCITGYLCILVPLMMFFMLKDKTELLAGVSRFCLKPSFSV